MNKNLSPLQHSQFLLHYAAYLLPLSHFLALQVCLLPSLQNFPCIPPSWVHLWVNPLLCSVISPCLLPFLPPLSCLILSFITLPAQDKYCHMLSLALLHDLHPTQAKIALLALKVSLDLYLGPLSDFSCIWKQSKKKEPFFFFFFF